ncbi:odorant receptor 22c-like [Solenopsis invicta]|uniref:odorant receptor 22c-like n=1 Tax=Solenopsis invicta TaxID=13686 RepID=UPI0005960D97|nr:odorant receptor 22c-like [Solenopsis invicta]
MLGRSKPKSSSLEPVADFNYSIQVNRLFMKSIGAWPFSLCETTMEKIGQIVLAMTSCFLLLFMFIPCTLCIILAKIDLKAKIAMVGPDSFILMGVCKQFALLTKSKSISECIRDIRADWDYIAMDSKKNREIMSTTAKFGRWLSTVSAIFMFSAGLFFTTITPIFAGKTEIIDNETVRSLAVPVYREILDPRSTPYFEIVLLTEAVGCNAIYSFTVSVYSMAAIFVMHTCGQFQILMLKMDDLADGKESKLANNTYQGRLGEIVKLHVRILSFIARIEELLNGICLVDVIGCTLNVCFLGFYLITEWENSEAIGTIMYGLLMTSFTFNIFILCYIGDLLADQCVEIGTKAYMIEWYRIHPNKGALGLMLMMTKSNSTLKLTAGKFFSLSLDTFGAVMRTSMAYLNLLRTFF